MITSKTVATWRSAVPDKPSRRPAATEEQVRALESDNRRLQERLLDLKEEVSRNDALLRKTQERELELLRASSLAAVTILVWSTREKRNSWLSRRTTCRATTMSCCERKGVAPSAI